MSDVNIPSRPRNIRAQKSSSLNLNQAGEAPTPSQEITSAAQRAPVTDIDELGRVLKIKYLGILDQMRISRVLGAELSKNDQYKALASLAFCVVEMNGETIIPPATVREVEFVVERLGEEGARAIGKAYQDNGWAAKEDGEDGIDTAKN